METLHTPIATYPFLNPFYLSHHKDDRVKHVSELKQRLNVKCRSSQLDPSTIFPYLEKRVSIFSNVVSTYFEAQTAEIAKQNLEAKNSFSILAKNTRLLDSLIHLAFDYALEDLSHLKKIQVSEKRKEKQYKEQILPEKIEKLEIIKKQLEVPPAQGDKEAQYMYHYYQKIVDDLKQEIESHKKIIQTLTEQLPLVEKCPIDRLFILDHFVVFARGGYGRGELSFASDRDLGYCLNTLGLSEGEIDLLQQLIIRMEHLLTNANIETSHQYFEIDEDLSRFTQEEMLHTIPSVLESRVLVGSDSLMELLKQRFYQILPYEPYVLNKLEEYSACRHPGLNHMDLKHDFGGLRSIQLPLWIAAATFGVFPSQTVELLALLIEKGILSSRQAFKLCQALELIYDLRNFSGCAVAYYYDEEVRDVGCIDTDVPLNVINDNVERLYILKKKRFENIDDFDRFRNLMVNHIQELSQMILKRLLQRTIVRTFSNFQVVVHLRKKRVIEIHAVEGLPQVPLPLIFKDPATILDLFIYLGNSDYDLSFELKDELTNVIPPLTAELISRHREDIADKFTQLMLTPHTSKALMVMLKICVPNAYNELPDTLLGRFIPEINQIRFLLRNLTYHQFPVCLHTIKAMENCYEELNYLKKNYLELYQFLQPKHLLALKFAILFHDIGKTEPLTQHQISGTSIAVRALERLGFVDEELFSLVSLLIVHHMTVVHLSRTSAYFDQALQTFFEIADRDLTQVVLLFLVNITDYRAVSDSANYDTKQLRQFFEEMYRVFSEIRHGKNQDPIDFINLFLRNKKKDLEVDTRIDLLINHSLQNDLQITLFDPLSQINTKEYKKLQQIESEVHKLWKHLKMGSLDAQKVDEYTDKLIRTLRQYLSDATILELTSSFNPTINWFFTTFPNRFLLSHSPSTLVKQLLNFIEYETKSIVSVLTDSKGKVTGILIHIHEMPSVHSRVAYALSVKNIDIGSGKMNKILFENGNVAYCYYFQVSSRSSSKVVFPRDLENHIYQDTPPKLKPTKDQFIYNPKLRLEFLDCDHKGYVIIQSKGEFDRVEKEYMRVKITMEDAPLVYYKMTEAFDRAGVPIQQSLITTTGYQVSDYFYVNREDHERLQTSDYEEILRSYFISP
ncbi:protein-PII uridylyltransferase [Deltaproteobacteria bacterium TL4]